MQRTSPPSPSTETVTTQVPLFTFRIAQQTFALPIEPVAQIIEMVTIIPLVKSSTLIEGVIRVRGNVVPVVDMRKFLGYEKTPYGLHTPIVLVHIHQQLIGLIVDEVLDVTQIPARQIAKPSDFLPTDLGSLPILNGVTQLNDCTALLLDLSHLFEPEQEKALSRAAKEAGDNSPMVPAVSQAVAAMQARQNEIAAALSPVKPENASKPKRAKKNGKAPETSVEPAPGSEPTEPPTTSE